jgi:hypothetical protein
MPPRQTTELPTSIRHGKLQPSQRYADPVAKKKSMESTLRFGINKVPSYLSTSHEASRESGSCPREVLAMKQPRIYRNGSEYVGEQFKSIIKNDPTTTYGSDFHKGCSVLSSVYEKSKPAFDRRSSSKTNYELSTSLSHFDLRSTSHVHLADPKTFALRRGFEQPVIGGWTKPNKEYCVDEISRAVRFPSVTNLSHHDFIFSNLIEYRPGGRWGRRCAWSTIQYCNQSRGTRRQI